jgi:hypothetical protein
MVVKAKRQPSGIDKRIYMRFDKAFSVTIGSEVYGDCRGVARNISAGGMFVELIEPPPLSSVVTVHFCIPDSGEAVVARAEVKHHYCLNVVAKSGPSVARGVGIRFIEFLEDSGRQLRSSFTRASTVH